MGALASIPWIEAVPFWVLLAVGLCLIGIDVYLTNDNHVMWVGVGVIAAAVAGAMRFGGEAQIVVFATTLVACILYARKLVARLPRREDQASSVVDLDHSVGTVLDVSESSPAEGRALIPDHGEWRVLSRRKEQLKPGERVRVVGREGLVLLVEPAPR
jgi:membrane protein implicated in regulation of membrane protease activity